MAAAQDVFAEKGYSGAGMRDVAALAGVSATLLLRYFGSKRGVFEAALDDIHPSELKFSDIERAQFGETLVRFILNPQWELKAPSMMALAIGDPEARDAAIRISNERVIGPLAAWLGPPHSEARALEILMMLFGFAVFTRRLPVASHSVEVSKEVGEQMALTVQAIVDRR